MKRLGSKSGILLFMAGVTVFSGALFLLAFFFDNKYTASGPQAENGLLTLDEEILREYPVLFLTHGWEIYRDVLLTPDDFAQGARPDEYIYIGQYGGFEGADMRQNPHGSATYRLNILIPAEPAAYTLELPEIYSAYTLYINGVKAEQFGNPDPGVYYPQTGNSAVSFLARNRAEIIVAVSDYSHMYSGMVYPPSFGLPQAVSAMIQTRFAVRAAVCSVALALALFFLLVGFFMGKDRAMLLLVMILQRVVSEDKSSLSKAFIAFGSCVCVCSLFFAATPTDDLRMLAAYSLLIGVFKWAAAFSLAAGMIRAAGKNTKYGLTMLGGVLVFCCALVFDRLMPMFEPVIFGWFLEIGGFAIVLTLGVAVGREALALYRDRLALKGRIAGIESLVEMQRAYYPVILESVEKARRARHDLRHHASLIQGLVLSGKYDELREYSEKYAAEFSGLSPLTFCENDVADVILRHFAVLSERGGVSFKVDAAIPETLPVDNADLCSVLSNLLENALEANAYVTGEGNKTISVVIKQIRNELVIIVDNSFDGNVRTGKSGFGSRKRRGREGAGIASVKAVAAKYGGSAEFKPDTVKKVFSSEVVIPVVCRPEL